MPENQTKDCPFCAEAVRAEAHLCPHCRSPLNASTRTPDAHRNRPGRQIAGVSIALAETCGISVTFVRLVFIVLTFVSFIGPIVYAALWILLPAEPGGVCPLAQLVTSRGDEPSILERLIRETHRLFEKVVSWFRSKATTAPTNGPEKPVGGAP